MLSEPPLAGRGEELGTLDGALQRVIGGAGGLFMISGEAGIGKTRLAKEFEARAVAKGCKVLVGNCVPSAQIPYLAFLEALKCLSNEGDHGRSSRLMHAAKRAAPDLMGAIPVVGGTARALATLLKEYQREDGSENKENLLFGTLDLLKTESEENPLIIRLDDLQWADSASIGMLHFLARNVRDLPIFLLGTYRTEEVLNREKEVHPLLDSLQVMRREGIVEEVKLHPLAERETHQVVSGMLQRPVQKAAMDRIFKESGGSPLFTVETLRMLVSEGRLVQKDGTWAITADGEIHIPRTIQEVIARRIAKLSQEQRRILEWASVIGERFDPSILSESMGVDELRILDELDTISQGFQLASSDEGDYKFTHAKIRDVTYDAISKPKRTELHKRVGCSLEKRLPDNALLGALSWHFDRALVKDKCIKYSLLAGRYCSARKAVTEAKSFYLLVIAKTDGDNDFVPERLEALEGLGDLSIYQSSAKDCYPYYEQFLGLNRDQKARARVLAKAGECWDQGGFNDTRKAKDLLDEAESLSEGDPQILAFIERERGDISTMDGNQVEAEAHYAKSRRYYEEVGDSIGIIRHRITELTQILSKDHVIEAKALAEELLPLARKSEDPELIAEVEYWNAEINAQIGETELAKMFATSVIQQSVKLGLMWNWRFGLRPRAVAYEQEGDPDSAIVDLNEGLELSKRYDTSYHIAWFVTYLGLCELELGRMERAEGHYEEGMKIAFSHESQIRSSLTFYRDLDLDLNILKAGLLAAKGHSEQSDDVYDEMIRSLEEKCWWFPLVKCRSRYGMSLARNGKQEKARAQFDEAMMLAKRVGSEKRVQLAAKRVGITIDVNRAQSGGT